MQESSLVLCSGREIAVAEVRIFLKIRKYWGELMLNYDNSSKEKSNKLMCFFG